MTELSPRLARLKFRAWHRGTREADYMIGCFFDRFYPEWSDGDVQWFEDLLEEDDVDVMAWALGTQIVPERFRGPLMERMKLLDYVEIPR
ncbi:succinate dehydrogenase assembly factor 2 [Novosphingobium sp.]|uniref:FAD assembly factor SdhE n=1 Tax=Novosphingobium sp. TaxID=1874826 RepID=UPI002B4695CF|nr:succinate dehydrogenase assembly factor 2 [Novosphingobium sp.]HKR93366.1 succinate dehydrogenase assembly factor 2 [Novosphingobium sp.]